MFREVNAHGLEFSEGQLGSIERQSNRIAEAFVPASNLERACMSRICPLRIS